jgi:tight adherence protein B
VFRQMRALTAEGRMSAYILAALPVLVAVAMRFFSPDAFARLTHGIGLALSAAACVMLLAGLFWMKKLVRIEF